MPRRILVLSKVTESHGAGGMQRHLSWLLDWLTAAGMEVTLVTTRGGTVPIGAGLRSVEVPGTRPGCYGAAWWRGTRRLIRQLGPEHWNGILSEDGGAWSVIDELRRDSWRPPIAMFRHGTTLINLRQTFPPRRLRAVGSMALSFRDWVRHPRRLARYVDLMICISERIAASARVEGAGPRTDIRVVPLGVDLNHFRPADSGSARKALGLSPSLPTLLWVGRDVPGKRVELALGLFDLLAGRGVPCQLAIAVAGPRASTLARLDALRRQHEGRAHLFADADRDQMQRLYQAASVLVFPSVLAEGVPLAILEALASGVPVLATPGPAFAELAVFRERPDWLVPSDRLELWAERTTAALDGKHADRARRDARAIAERCYDLGATARQTLEALDQLIDRWPRPKR